MKLRREEIRMRDPFVLAENGRYYVYFSYGVTPFDSVPVPGLGCLVSDDLENFEGPYTVFAPGADFWGKSAFWAPEVHKYEGAYYMFATFFSDEEGRRCQILRAESPTDPFLPWSVPITPAGQWCLDATLYVHDGKPYSVYCREWLKVKNGEMWLTELSPDLKSPVGEPTLLFKALDAEWAIPFGDGNAVTDAPFIYRLKNGKLVMLWSSFGAGGYTVGMAVCDGKDIRSGWRQLEKPLFADNGGHAMIFMRDGQPLMALHSPNAEPDERMYFIAVKENDDRLVLA